MEKPGSGPAQPRQLIIDNRSALRVRDRVAEVGITFFFWMLLLYLWQPLLSFLAWWFQGYVFYRHMIDLGGYAAFAETAINYVLLVFLFDGVFLLWARINQWRFRDNERRGPVPDTSLLEHCLYLDVEPLDVEQWRTYHQMVVRFNEDGTIVDAVPVSLAEFRAGSSLSDANGRSAKPLP